MTNSENIRQKADPALAVWLADRIACYLCPIANKCKLSGRDIRSESCAELLLEWLEEEMGKDD